METYTLRDAAKKIGWVLQLARNSDGFEDKDFYPKDIVDVYYKKFYPPDGLKLTEDEVREICKAMYELGELTVTIDDPDCFSRSLYCSPSLQKSIVNLAPTIQEFLFDNK